MPYLEYRYFYPRPPGGGRPSASKGRKRRRKKFLSTPSGWRATELPIVPDLPDFISIHALRVEGDRSPLRDCFNGVDFYPRPPGGGRPAIRATIPAMANFYPRPPGGGRRIRAQRHRQDDYHFYPRPPGGGRRAKLGVSFAVHRHFYPRPPGGGRPGFLCNTPI